MSNKKRVLLLDDPGTVFQSIGAAAVFCGGQRASLSRALKRGSIYRGFSFILEGSDTKPKIIKGKNLTNHPGIGISEFDTDGELLRIYPSKHEAARKMGIHLKSLNMILENRLKNHSGKNFALSTPLDYCLIEIRERNNDPTNDRHLPRRSPPGQDLRPVEPRPQDRGDRHRAPS